ncbi:hypothetical protein D7X33_22185, partial [Butyricicoccus sp. 1XD8-22]
MSTLLFFYDNYYQSIQLDQRNKDTVTVGNDSSHTVTIRSLSFTDGFLTITEDPFGFRVEQNEKFLGKVNPKQFFEWKDAHNEKILKIILFQTITRHETYFLGKKQEIYFSTESNEADIVWKSNVHKEPRIFSLLK